MFVMVQGETIGAVVQPLPTSHLIFRAPTNAAGKCWMDALELALRYGQSSFITLRYISSSCMAQSYISSCMSKFYISSSCMAQSYIQSSCMAQSYTCSSFMASSGRLLRQKATSRRLVWLKASYGRLLRYNATSCRLLCHKATLSRLFINFRYSWQICYDPRVYQVVLYGPQKLLGLFMVLISNQSRQLFMTKRHRWSSLMGPGW